MSAKSERRRMIREQNAKEKIGHTAVKLSDRIVPGGASRQIIKQTKSKLKSDLAKAQMQLEAATA